MTLASTVICLAATAMIPVASPALPVWNGIASGQTVVAVAQQVFVDARNSPHRLSRHSVMEDFYLQRNNPANVRVRYRGNPGLVCGVDIEGARATLERQALLSELGPPASRVMRELPGAPGGSSALLSGGKLFWISTWHRGSTVITFEERNRPGYFAILYRITGATGSKVDC